VASAVAVWDGKFIAVGADATVWRHANSAPPASWFGLDRSDRLEPSLELQCRPHRASRSSHRPNLRRLDSL